MSFASISEAIGSLRVPGSSKGVSRAAIKGALGDITAARINVALKKVRHCTRIPCRFSWLSFSYSGFEKKREEKGSQRCTPTV